MTTRVAKAAIFYSLSSNRFSLTQNNNNISVQAKISLHAPTITKYQILPSFPELPPHSYVESATESPPPSEIPTSSQQKLLELKEMLLATPSPAPPPLPRSSSSSSSLSSSPGSSTPDPGSQNKGLEGKNVERGASDDDGDDNDDDGAAKGTDVSDTEPGDTIQKRGRVECPCSEDVDEKWKGKIKEKGEPKFSESVSSTGKSPSV